MSVLIGKEILTHLDSASTHEWIETDGLGGFASSSLSFAQTRKYHGMLVSSVCSATHPGRQRHVLVSKWDETLITKETRIELTANYFPGTTHPEGNRHLRSFTRGLFPVWEYEVAGIALRKTIFCPHERSATVILYEVLEAPHTFTIECRPLFAARHYHALHCGHEAVLESVTDTGHATVFTLHHGLPPVSISAPMHFVADELWINNVELRTERMRGFDSAENLYVPGFFVAQVSKGSKLGVIISTETEVDLDPYDIFEKERARREHLLRKAHATTNVEQLLILAADQFLVKSSQNKPTIYAGYPWFTNWGRDTMIALPGLCLATGRANEAREILQAALGTVSQGMLPNRIDEVTGNAEYNSVDAMLWFFVALFRYYETTNDRAFIESEALPVLQEALTWYEHGTRFGIQVDHDGLLIGGNPTTQLTWMDAKVGNWIVTARPGKPVEVNALWYNALCIMAAFCELTQQKKQIVKYKQRAAQVRTEFYRQFWFEEGGYLFDFLDGSIQEKSIRPNQIFALSLPFPLMPDEQARRMLDVVRRHLYTPAGLRTLSPEHPSYRGYYGGNPATRDAAYHQGTAWAFLLGPYISALLRYGGDTGAAEARQVFHEGCQQLSQGGIGSISEIADGNYPHTLNGCFAQAWSVGELLRGWKELR